MTRVRSSAAPAPRKAQANLLEDRAALAALGRAGFAKLPAPKSSLQAKNVLSAFIEKFGAGPLSKKELSVVKSGTKLILEGGNAKHRDELQFVLGELTRKGKPSDRALLKPLLAQALGTSEGWKAGGRKRTEVAAPPAWPFPGSTRPQEPTPSSETLGSRYGFVPGPELERRAKSFYWNPNK